MLKGGSSLVIIGSLLSEIEGESSSRDEFVEI